MSLSIGKGAALAVPRFQSALRKLASHGADALKPQVVTAADATSSHWKPALISNRVANVLRKQAMLEGTYGTFNWETLRGWDAAWDVELATRRSKGSGRIKLRPPNKASRQRNRERRAMKIEANMQDMDERIETYYQEKRDAKPVKTFENYYKKLMQTQR